MRGLFDGRIEYRWAIDAKFTGIPETVIHYAEQPSAPFSMISYQQANSTIQNNLLVTNNLMFAVRDFSRETHIIKLGTMGEYGTPNIDIEEGWLEIEHKGRKGKFLFPRAAGSIYHHQGDGHGSSLVRSKDLGVESHGPDARAGLWNRDGRVRN